MRMRAWQQTRAISERRWGEAEVSSPFDLMASADFLVPDRDAAVAMVERVLGFGKPKPRWSWGDPGQGFRVTFCRPHRTLRQSPTLVELIEPAPVDPALPMSEVVWNLAGLAARQRDRPLKTHGAPIASSAVDELIERVRRLGLRHWVQPSSDAYPFSRLWMGVTIDDLADYRTGGDGGLMIEVIDTRTVGLPADVLADASSGAGVVPIDDDAAGTMVRTAARVFLVDDLDRSLEELAHAFMWEPEVGPEDGEDGARRAVLGFRLPQSARIELLAPADESDAGSFLKQWGPGIWHVRIAVTDLDAKAADLRARGTRFELVRTGFEHPEVVLRVDPDSTPACRFEFAALNS
jgi:hypothetical protein